MMDQARSKRATDIFKPKGKEHLMHTSHNFFKWLEQHLKIKKFWGKTENAVGIQISAAIIAYCLVAIVQHDIRLDRST